MQERFPSVFPLNRTLLVSATREGQNGVWGSRERRSPGDDNRRSMMPLVEAEAEQHFRAPGWVAAAEFDSSNASLLMNFHPTTQKTNGESDDCVGR